MDGTDANQQSRLNGNSSSIFQGAFYFPSQQVTFNGTTGMHDATACSWSRAIVSIRGDMHISQHLSGELRLRTPSTARK